MQEERGLFFPMQTGEMPLQETGLEGKAKFSFDRIGQKMFALKYMKPHSPFPLINIDPSFGHTV